MLAKIAISVFDQLNTALAEVAIGPKVFHAQYCVKATKANINNIQYRRL